MCDSTYLFYLSEVYIIIIFILAMSISTSGRGQAGEIDQADHIGISGGG
jgi:hypothetical protein